MDDWRDTFPEHLRPSRRNGLLYVFVGLLMLGIYNVYELKVYADMGEIPDSTRNGSYPWWINFFHFVPLLLSLFCVYVVAYGRWAFAVALPFKAGMVITTAKYLPSNIYFMATNIGYPAYDSDPGGLFEMVPSYSFEELFYWGILPLSVCLPFLVGMGISRYQRAFSLSSAEFFGSLAAGIVYTLLTEQILTYLAL